MATQQYQLLDNATREGDSSPVVVSGGDAGIIVMGFTGTYAKFSLYAVQDTGAPYKVLTEEVTSPTFGRLSALFPVTAGSYFIRIEQITGSLDVAMVVGNSVDADFWFSGAGQPADGFYIDVQQRAASTAMPTTPTTFVWTTKVSDTDNAYNATTGVITLPFTGVYTFNFMFNTETASGQHHIISAAEVWNGTAWVKSEYSARQQAVRSGDNSQATYVSTNRFPAGTQLRFPTWCDSGVSIVTETPTNGAGFTIPAARLLITAVKSD